MNKEVVLFDPEKKGIFETAQQMINDLGAVENAIAVIGSLSIVNYPRQSGADLKTLPDTSSAANGDISYYIDSNNNLQLVEFNESDGQWNDHALPVFTVDGFSRYLQVNFKAIGGVGDNSTDNYTTLTIWRSEVGQNDPVELFFPKGIYHIGSDFSFFKNLNLVFAKGAVIKPVNGSIIYIGSTIKAGRYQIFDDSNGSFRITSENHQRSQVYPEWFGSVQGAIDAIPSVSQTAGGGGRAKILLSAKTYNESVQIGSDGQSKDIVLQGAGKYNTSINGGAQGPAITSIDSRIGLLDLYAACDPDGTDNAVEILNPQGGADGSYGYRLGCSKAGNGALYIQSGARYWFDHYTMYGCKEGLILGDDVSGDIVTRSSFTNFKIRESSENTLGYALNLRNFSSTTIEASAVNTTTPINVNNGGSASTINLIAPALSSNALGDISDAISNTAIDSDWTINGEKMNEVFSLNPNVNLNSRLLPVGGSHFNLQKEGHGTLTFTNNGYGSVASTTNDRREQLQPFSAAGLGKASRKLYCRLQMLVKNNTDDQQVSVRVQDTQADITLAEIQTSTAHTNPQWLDSGWVEVDSNVISANAGGSHRFRLEGMVAAGQGEINVQSPGLIFAIDLGS